MKKTKISRSIEQHFPGDGPRARRLREAAEEIKFALGVEEHARVEMGLLIQFWDEARAIHSGFWPKLESTSTESVLRTASSSLIIAAKHLRRAAQMIEDARAGSDTEARINELDRLVELEFSIRLAPGEPRK